MTNQSIAKQNPNRHISNGAFEITEVKSLLCRSMSIYLTTITQRTTIDDDKLEKINSIYTGLILFLDDLESQMVIEN